MTLDRTVAHRPRPVLSALGAASLDAAPLGTDERLLLAQVAQGFQVDLHGELFCRLSQRGLVETFLDEGRARANGLCSEQTVLTAKGRLMLEAGSVENAADAALVGLLEAYHHGHPVLSGYPSSTLEGNPCGPLRAPQAVIQRAFFEGYAVRRFLAMDTMENRTARLTEKGAALLAQA